ADLEARGLLYAKALNTHSYPHCYRCGTPLIYNAVSSWFINIQAIKERLLEENKHITWAPEHLKHGRFTHIVENAPDWTISRNRFWASPLPIWKDSDGNVTVIGSLEELKAHTKKSGNRYFAMRHGEAESTLKEIISCAPDENPLTEKGKEDIRKNAAQFKDMERIRIFASPVLRAKESAQVLARELGIAEADVVIDERLCEFKLGTFEGKKLAEFLAWRNEHSFEEVVEGGESHADARRRFGEFLYEIEKTHQRETIIIVTHGIGLESLSVVTQGLSAHDAEQYIKSMSHQPGEVIELDFTPLPHTREFELDYHLPYIDQVELQSADGRALTRIPEVVDCWVESGSMPFAEYHYPMEGKEEFEKRSPGDFVSEYIGQTRAWFYYMHAISVSLFDRAPFRNVVTTGTILAGNGEKISKSKKNYTDPYVLFDQYSADAFRYYLMASVVMQAEDLTFRDEDVKEAQNRVVNMIRNIYAFYALYKDDLDPKQTGKSTHVLDRWIIARLNDLIASTTESLDRYDITRAVRPMREFIEDLSTWYVRRSRDRVKSTDEADKQAALRTMRHVLYEFSKVIAPVMPFVADEVYRNVKGEKDPESVHLAAWPTADRSFLGNFFGDKDQGLMEGMKQVRSISSTALMERQKANVKVRQPLQALTIRESGLSEELLALIKEELNVKEIRVDASLPEGEVRLDTELTPELIREGDIREFVRAVQDARKALDLSPRDTVSLVVEKSGETTLEGALIPNTQRVTFADGAHPYSAELSGGAVAFSVTRMSDAA
ncbi:MAG TPA: class I tRNA ligase family protein, partial [Candidatus Paceibacterota bacterium]|nr:class I tRNA ligase family protein [Candidatus Paceibacterota bacterium]